MRVLLFAALRELAGTATIETDAGDVASLLEELASRYGAEFDRIARSGSVLVDGQRAGGSRALNGATEVAVLPPVSGGAVRTHARNALPATEVAPRRTRT